MMMRKTHTRNTLLFPFILLLFLQTRQISCDLMDYCTDCRSEAYNIICCNVVDKCCRNGAGVSTVSANSDISQPSPPAFDYGKPTTINVQETTTDHTNAPLESTTVNLTTNSANSTQILIPTTNTLSLTPTPQTTGSQSATVNGSDVNKTVTETTVATSFGLSSTLTPADVRTSSSAEFNATTSWITGPGIAIVNNTNTTTTSADSHDYSTTIPPWRTTADNQLKTSQVTETTLLNSVNTTGNSNITLENLNSSLASGNTTASDKLGSSGETTLSMEASTANETIIHGSSEIHVSPTEQSSSSSKFITDLTTNPNVINTTLPTTFDTNYSEETILNLTSETSTANVSTEPSHSSTDSPLHKNSTLITAGVESDNDSTVNMNSNTSQSLNTTSIYESTLISPTTPSTNFNTSTVNEFNGTTNTINSTSNPWYSNIWGILKGSTTQHPNHTHSNSSDNAENETLSSTEKPSNESHNHLANSTNKFNTGTTTEITPIANTNSSELLNSTTTSSKWKNATSTTDYHLSNQNLSVTPSTKTSNYFEETTTADTSLALNSTQAKYNISEEVNESTIAETEGNYTKENMTEIPHNNTYFVGNSTQTPNISLTGTGKERFTTPTSFSNLTRSPIIELLNPQINITTDLHNSTNFSKLNDTSSDEILSAENSTFTSRPFETTRFNGTDNTRDKNNVSSTTTTHNFLQNITVTNDTEFTITSKFSQHTTYATPRNSRSKTTTALLDGIYDDEDDDISYSQRAIN